MLFRTHSRLNYFYFITALFVALSGCSSGPTRGGAGPVGTIYRGEERFLGSSIIHRYELANGLAVLVLEDHSSPTFSYHTWFNVGSMDEQKGLTGLAHLFEHMMFKATATRPEGVFDRTLEAAGVEGENAFTSRDYTAYVQSLPSDKLEMITELESDRMVNLIVNKDSLDKEREVVKNERRLRTENSPEGTMYETIYDMAFTRHPYHWPVIGYETDLNNAQPQQCLDFYRNHYAPNNATIVVVGDVNRDKVVELVHKYYGNLKPQNVQRYTGKDEPEQRGGRSRILHLSVPVQKFFAGYRVPGPLHEDGPTLELLANLVGHTQSSRLYRRLVDAGIASAVDVSVDNGKGGGLFLVTASLQKGKRAADALQAMEAEMWKIHKDGFTADELSTALNQYRFELFSGLESNAGKARMIGHMEIEFGSVAKAVASLNAMNKLTVADVNRAARHYLRSSQRSTVVALPKGAQQ